jgi:hypothetical protein
MKSFPDPVWRIVHQGGLPNWLVRVQVYTRDQQYARVLQLAGSIDLGVLENGPVLNEDTVARYY